MDDVVEPVQSDFEPKHSQLPSVEFPHTDRSRQWDYGISEEEHSAALKASPTPASRIPRPVTRSKDSAGGDVGTGPSLHIPGTVPTSGTGSFPPHGVNGFDNPAFNDEQEKTAPTTRQPRYGLNMYNSYDEMLANMESDDPFTGEPPPPKPPRESHTSRSHRRSHDIAMEPMPGRPHTTHHHRTHTTRVSAPSEDTTHRKKKKVPTATLR